MNTVENPLNKKEVGMESFLCFTLDKILSCSRLEWNVLAPSRHWTWWV